MATSIPSENTSLPDENLRTAAAPAPLRYDVRAYPFLVAALRRTQRRLGRRHGAADCSDGCHITGQELLEGIREQALEQFGYLARTVFRCWGVQATDDFGRMVFEMIDRGEMRKTDDDRLSDFCDVYDFAEALERGYRADLRRAL